MRNGKRLFLVRNAQQVIYRNAMELRELYQYFGRDVDISALIVAVNALAAFKYFGYILLPKVFVFTQIPNSFIHRITPSLIMLSE